MKPKAFFPNYFLYFFLKNFCYIVMSKVKFCFRAIFIIYDYRRIYLIEVECSVFLLEYFIRWALYILGAATQFSLSLYLLLSLLPPSFTISILFYRIFLSPLMLKNLGHHYELHTVSFLAYYRPLPYSLLLSHILTYLAQLKLK